MYNFNSSDLLKLGDTDAYWAYERLAAAQQALEEAAVPVATDAFHDLTSGTVSGLLLSARLAVAQAAQIILNSQKVGTK